MATESRSEVVAELLSKEFPGIDGIWAVNGSKIHMGNAAEGGLIDDLPACDYYSDYDDPMERIWVMGVNKQLMEFLEKLGWYIEWEDPGTCSAYMI